MKRLGFLSVFILASQAFALSTPWQINKHGQVRLISEYDVAPASGTIRLGLQHKTIPGWHVYWKNAGDAGYAPRLNWLGSQGIEIPTLYWPAPTKFLLPGDLVAYGYEGEVVYPIEVPISRRAKSIRLELKLDYLTCSEPCVPYKVDMVLDLPIGAAQIDPEASSLISQYAALVPPAAQTDAQIQAQAPVHRVAASETSEVPAATSWVSLAFMFLLAALGGLILNVMPCVLPVLSIKLLGLLQSSGMRYSLIVRNAMATAAGILVSFLGLALFVVALKQAGHVVGWGTQFQNPLFVGFLFVVVIVFGLNLWGLFEIPMPRAFGHLVSARGTGEGLAPHFMSGLFATLLATPCSAPFLGTAMGFALAQSPLIIVGIFLAAGFGLAIPYFLIAIFPGSIHALPRPGAWMGKVRLILGFLLFGTAAWLGWVFVQQVRAPQAASTAVQAGWEVFDESAIAKHLAEGKSVFVDITADWCFTCKYNEKVVLNSRAIRAAFEKQGLVLMQGDWTRRDATIGRFLMKHGRAGIPFAAIYRPGKKPILLPEFLTEKIVLQALNS